MVVHEEWHVDPPDYRSTYGANSDAPAAFAPCSAIAGRGGESLRGVKGRRGDPLSFSHCEAQSRRAPGRTGDRRARRAGGAEPSLAIDTTNLASRNSIYVTAIGGPNIWRSTDMGKTFGAPVAYDTSGPSKGSDADVLVDRHGNVVVVDLNVAYALVQVSTDHAKTFSAGFQTAPEDDRPWLGQGAGDTIYVSYHDFAAELPVVCTSTDGGATFLTCNTVYLSANAPLGPCLENTDPGRALRVDPLDGSLNFQFACSTAAQNGAQPPYGPIHDFYLAKSKDGGVTWTTSTIFQADTSGGKSPSYGNFWTSLSIDAAGNYYTVFPGTADDNTVPQNPYHVYLAVSKDHGVTWGKPIQVDNEADGKGTHVLTDVVATAAGQLEIVWYGTTATGEPNGVCGDFAAQGPCPNNEGLPSYKDGNAPGWRVSMAQTKNALDAQPTFQVVPLTSYFTHWGELCVNGLVCGSSDRSLLDFISLGVDCLGNAHVAYAGTGRRDASAKVRVSNQTGGDTIAPPAACGPVQAAAAPTPTPAIPAPTPTPTAAPLPNTNRDTGGSYPAPVAALTLLLVAGLVGLIVRIRRGSR
jgi:hypothetical protein